MADTAMLQAPAAFPVKAEARASPFPFAQRVTTVVSQTTRPAAAAAAAAAGHTSVSTVSAMAFDLDFLDPNSSASAGLSGLPSAHLNRNPLDDLNLLDGQPPLLTMPGDTDTAAAPSVGAPIAGASALVAGAQQFSDASSVSSADGSPLSPNDSANQSFSSTPTSPLTPGSPPISPAQPALAPHAAAHALMPGVGQMPGQMPQLQLPYGVNANAATMAAWSMAAAASQLPLPMYPLSSAAAPHAALAAAIAAQQQRHGYVPPQAAAAYAQAAAAAVAAATAKPTAGLSVQLPHAARAAAAKPQPAKAAASASASASVSPPSSAAAKARGAKPAPAKPEPALSSAAKGRRGKGAAAGKATAGSPSGSDEDDGADGADGTPGQPADKNSKRERNKLSAMKYRKRRKVYLDGLEGKVNDLNETITTLHTENKLLKEQLDFLKNLLKSGGGELPEGFTGAVKFGDTTKPMSHVANQPPALPKIPRPSQHAKPHSTLALFCVLACVLLCITSPNSLFSVLAPSAPLSSHGGALSPSASASVPAFAHAPPSEAVAHRSRVLLECVCARPPAAGAADGSPTAGDPAVSTDAAAAANANHTAFTSDCACADDAAADAVASIDVEQCDTAVPAQPEAAPIAVAVH